MWRFWYAIERLIRPRLAKAAPMHLSSASAAITQYDYDSDNDAKNNDRHRGIERQFRNAHAADPARSHT